MYVLSWKTAREFVASLSIFFLFYLLSFPFQKSTPKKIGAVLPPIMQMIQNISFREKQSGYFNFCSEARYHSAMTLKGIIFLTDIFSVLKHLLVNRLIFIFKFYPSVVHRIPLGCLDLSARCVPIRLPLGDAPVRFPDNLSKMGAQPFWLLELVSVVTRGRL